MRMTSPRSLHIICCFISLFVFSLSVGILASTEAWAANHTVSDIAVSVTADDATQARVQALAEAEQKGFAKLMHQLLPAGQAEAKQQMLSPDMIGRMVRSYDVHEEKIGAKSYSAMLDITFDGNMVNSLLSGQSAMAAPPAMGAPNSAMAAPAPSAQPGGYNQAASTRNANTVLVLPVQSNGGATLLWEGSNAWRSIWNGIERADTQMVRLPIGDQSDKVMLSSDQVKFAPFENFGAIAERYQAATVLVAEAVLSTNDEGWPALDVNLRSVSADGQTRELTLPYEASPGEDKESLMLRAANDVAQRLLSGGSASAQSDLPQNKVTVLTRLNALRDWVVVRKRLMAIPNVDKVELSAISNHQADMVLYFRGNPDGLVNSMTAQGLQVKRAYNYWVVAF